MLTLTGTTLSANGVGGPNATPVIQELKIATAIQHKQLEQRVNLLERLNSTVTYRDLLAEFYGFYEPLEAKIAAFNLPFDFIQERAKSSWLERDLQQLRLTREQISDLPKCHSLPVLNSVAQALGCMYVLEGSTLGGQIIAREIKQKLQLDETNGALFFNGYGEETGSMWKSFGAAVNNWVAQNGQRSMVIASAKESFEKFGQWLAQTGAENS